jgi:hypothetical protein
MEGLCAELQGVSPIPLLSEDQFTTKGDRERERREREREREEGREEAALLILPFSGVYLPSLETESGDSAFVFQPSGKYCLFSPKPLRDGMRYNEFSSPLRAPAMFQGKVYQGDTGSGNCVAGSCSWASKEWCPL